jgi:hypothetical protein
VRMRSVHPHAGEPASRVLVEAERGRAARAAGRRAPLMLHARRALHAGGARLLDEERCKIAHAATVPGWAIGSRVRADSVVATRHGGTAAPDTGGSGDAGGR